MLRTMAVFLAFFAVLAPFCAGAETPSAKPGLVNFTEGRVLVNGSILATGSSGAVVLKEGDILSTDDGRAEVLLAPGMFLRIDEKSSVAIQRLRLLDIRIKVIAGSAMLECLSWEKEVAVGLFADDIAARVEKAGLYRLDVSLGWFSVLNGEARAALPNGTLVRITKGKRFVAGTSAAAKFDKKEEDALAKWSRVRARQLAQASQSAVQTIIANGMWWPMGGWYWHPYFSMFTYVPYGSTHSFYGYRYMSPREAQGMYGMSRGNPEMRRHPPEGSPGGQQQPHAPPPSSPPPSQSPPPSPPHRDPGNVSRPAPERPPHRTPSDK